MADFAFRRQADSAVAETTKIFPLTCHGHSRPITHISFTPLIASSTSNQPTYYMISACKDNSPMLREGLTGDWVGTFIGHKGAVWSARLSDDSVLAATGSADFSAKVWDTFSGETLFTLQHNHIVRAVAFPPGPNPQVLATGGMEKRLRIFDLSQGSDTYGIATRNGTTNGNGSVDTTPSYEVGEGIHEGAIKSIIWTHDPNVLLTASDDKTIRWWDLRSRSLLASYSIDAPPTSCELNTGFDSDPTGIVSVAAGKNIYFFSGSTSGQLIKHIKTEREIASVALDGKTRRFVTGSPGDTWVHVWDFEREVEIEVGRGHHGPVWTVVWSPDGGIYATGSEDGTIKLWKGVKEGPYGLWR